MRACGIALEFRNQNGNGTSKCRACGAEYVKSGVQLQPVELNKNK
jgi:DNA-directed RNA polymerase subunit M/transcription elongation factor TFIIS